MIAISREIRNLVGWPMVTHQSEVCCIPIPMLKVDIIKNVIHAPDYIFCQKKTNKFDL